MQPFPLPFLGKSALVAGGGSGIGSATCELFARRGGAVLVADVDAGSAQAVAARIRRIGGRAKACGCDITRREDVDAAIQQMHRLFGGMDVLVNCAGILRSRSMEETSETEWIEVLNVNLTGAFLLTKAALRAMRKQGGAILHIASRMALRIKENRGAYAPAKAGMVQLARMAALEGAPHGIRVNCLCPGLIDTPMTRGSQCPEKVEAEFALWAGVCPLGRVGRAEEVARAALFLASDDASFITGAVLPVDGGRTIL